MWVRKLACGKSNLVTYSFAGLVLLLEDIENAFEMIPLALHGPEDELEELLVDIRYDFVKLWMAGVRVGQHNLDDLRELLLEDLFDKFAGSALWDGLGGFALFD
jgi:hypothetical protein